MEIMEMSIKSDAFLKFRQNFDKLLFETITKMQQKGSSDASLTIKLDIELEKTFAPVEDLSGDQSFRDVYIPHFAHKITSAMQIKSEVKGKYDEECELVYDEGTGKYLLVPIGQMTLGDEINREDEDE